jgi:hypothetical protein
VCYLYIQIFDNLWDNQNIEGNVVSTQKSMQLKNY